MNESVISANDLSLTFETNDGPVHALQDINLDIEKGEFVSFIGPSGCGKTTLLRVIADLETPTNGVVKVNDVDNPLVVNYSFGNVSFDELEEYAQPSIMIFIGESIEEDVKTLCAQFDFLNLPLFRLKK